MERVVQEVHGSLLVAIPRESARQLGIHKGSRMHVNVQGSALLLQPIPLQQTLWTIGYEGETPDTFVKLLVERGIRQLVDVRELAASRRRGFGKTALAERLAQEDIVYRHLRALGAPKEVRRPFVAGGSFAPFREAYLAHLESQSAAVTDLLELARQAPTAIMCVERIHSMCHRQFIAATAHAQGFEVRHV